MMKRIFAMILAACALMLFVVGCGGEEASIPQAGKTYTAKSEEDAYGSSAELTVTYDEKGNISEVQWKEYSYGELKDEQYGKEAGDEAYEKAQSALKASRGYAETLLNTGDIDKVEAVSGATTSYGLFVQLYKEIEEQFK